MHVCATHKKPGKVSKLITKLRQAEREKGIRNGGAIIIFCNKIKTVLFLTDHLNNDLNKKGGQLCFFVYCRI